MFRGKLRRLIAPCWILTHPTFLVNCSRSSRILTHFLIERIGIERELSRSSLVRSWWRLLRRIHSLLCLNEVLLALERFLRLVGLVQQRPLVCRVPSKVKLQNLTVYASAWMSLTSAHPRACGPLQAAFEGRCSTAWGLKLHEIQVLEYRLISRRTLAFLASNGQYDPSAGSVPHLQIYCWTLTLAVNFSSHELSLALAVAKSSSVPHFSLNYLLNLLLWEASILIRRKLLLLKFDYLA